MVGGRSAVGRRLDWGDAVGEFVVVGGRLDDRCCERVEGQTSMRWTRHDSENPVRVQVVVIGTLWINSVVEFQSKPSFNGRILVGTMDDGVKI
jgi:hypothetical protein